MFCKQVRVCMVVMLVLLVVSAVSMADDNVTWRPIEEWVAAQGTLCRIDVTTGKCQEWLPGIARNFPAVAEVDGCQCALVDYAGIVAEWLDVKSGGAIKVPTKISGTVQEKPVQFTNWLGETWTAAEVSVDLMTKDAITWVFRDCLWPGECVYGARYDEILAGAQPTLSDVFVHVDFMNTAPGAPLPDLVDLMLNPGDARDLRSEHIVANGEGRLRALYGVPEGTPGRIHVISNVLYNASSHIAYGTPVSNIKLEVVQGNPK